MHKYAKGEVKIKISIMFVLGENYGRHRYASAWVWYPQKICTLIACNAWMV